MIRAISPDEAAILLPLNALVHRLHSDLRPDLFRADPAAADVEEYFRDWLTQPGIAALVAEPAGRAIGYVVTEVQDRPGSALMMPLRRGFLHHIAVLPEFRRQGVATALVEAAKARFRSADLTQWATSYWGFNAASAALMAKAGLTPAHLVADGAL